MHIYLSVGDKEAIKREKYFCGGNHENLLSSRNAWSFSFKTIF
jgi:hypothetical protein